MDAISPANAGPLDRAGVGLRRVPPVLQKSFFVALLAAVLVAVVAAPAAAAPVRASCPPGSTGYTGELQPWSCVSAYRDLSGHNVNLRSGRSGAAGFGLLHTIFDHNVDESTIADVISTAPAAESQGGTRFLYQKKYALPTEALTVWVFEERGPSNIAPDDFATGLITAYCLGRQECPDELGDLT